MLISLQQLRYLANDPQVRDAAYRILSFLGEGTEIEKLTNVKGFIYKRELIQKVFNGSRHSYRLSIQAYIEYNQNFSVRYAKYRQSKRIPIHLVVPFLKHIGEEMRL
jgi:hypothetical protein